MKKVLTILLSVMMLASLATTSVLAEDPDTGTDSHSGTIDASGSGSFSGTTTIDVTANITKDDGGLDGEKVYCVDIAWSMTPANYTSEGDTYHWNPATLKYERVAPASDSLSGSDAKVSITVTNKSNAAIGYDIAYKSASGISSAESSTSGSKTGKLESAEPATISLSGSPATSEAGTATKATFTSKVGMSTSGAAASNLVMGTYTVKVKKPSYKISTAYVGKDDDNWDHAYAFDGGNSLVELNEGDPHLNEENIDTKYLVYYFDNAGCGRMNSIDVGTCAKLVKRDDLSSNEKQKICEKVSELMYYEYTLSEDMIYNDPTNDLGDCSRLFVFEIIGDGTITFTGTWDE